jgi:ABC-type antimicrobial peptide transport system permease subunit
MGFVVGVIIVYQVLSTDVNSHLKEYATFKAMGYNNMGSSVPNMLNFYNKTSK